MGKEEIETGMAESLGYFGFFKGLFTDPSETLKSVEGRMKKVSIYSAINLAIILFLFLIYNSLSFLFSKIDGSSSGFGSLYETSFSETLNFGGSIEIIIGIAIILVAMAGIFWLFGKLFGSEKSFKDYFNLSFASTFFFLFGEAGRLFMHVINFGLGYLEDLLSKAEDAVSYGSFLVDFIDAASEIVDTVMSFEIFFILAVLVFLWIMLLVVLSDYYGKSPLTVLFLMVFVVLFVGLVFSILEIFGVLSDDSILYIGFNYLRDKIGISSGGSGIGDLFESFSNMF